MKTIRIKIAVAVDGAGNWNACGYAGPKFDSPTPQDVAEDAIGGAVDGLDSGDDCQGVVWVTAEIPIPEVATVEGSVGELEPVVDTEF